MFFNDTWLLEDRLTSMMEPFKSTKKKGSLDFKMVFTQRMVLLTVH